MERNARIILVSAFVLACTVALVLFYRWIDVAATAEDSTMQAIQFNGSVSGLSIGSEVRYLGVPVGRVESIDINSQTAGRVDVSFGAEQPLPTANSLLASLQPQGITGLSIIELRDRDDEDEVFEVPAGVIPGYPSLITQLSSTAGDITRTADEVLIKINAMLDEAAMTSIGNTFEQIDTTTANLAAATADLEELIASINRSSLQLEQALPDYRAVAVGVNENMVPSVVDAANALRDASDAVTGTLGANQAELNRLLNQELPSLIGLTDELARSLQSLNQTMGNINDEPGAILYGEQVPEIPIDD